MSITVLVIIQIHVWLSDSRTNKFLMEKGISNMGLMIEEQETHVNFNRNDERAVIYTSDTTMMTKFNKLVELQDTEWKIESVSKLKNGELIGKTYSCPVNFVSFRRKKIEREYSEERKKEIAERLHQK